MFTPIPPRGCPFQVVPPWDKACMRRWITRKEAMDRYPAAPLPSTVCDQMADGTMRWHMTPDPVPLLLFRSLVDQAGGISAAVRITHAGERSIDRWYSGAEARIPWAIAELLRLHCERQSAP